MIMAAITLLLAFSANACAAITPITHGIVDVFQSYSGTTAGKATQQMGFAGTAAPSSISYPGVLVIQPGMNWANYVFATWVSSAYTLTNVHLTKTSPGSSSYPVFPALNLVQSGAANVRIRWPLLYEVPGTLFNLTIDYTTPTAQEFAGEQAAGTVHRDVWTWRVVPRVDNLSHLLEVFRNLPFGTSLVPLASDETLYSTLQGYLMQALSSYTSGDFAGMTNSLTSFENSVVPAEIASPPAYPVPTGAGTGIAISSSNPAAYDLLMDSTSLHLVSQAQLMQFIYQACDSAAVEITSPCIATVVNSAGGWFFMQDPNRTVGIKVYVPAWNSSVVPGVQTWVVGTMGTEGAMRVIHATAVVTENPATMPSPLGMTNLFVGGVGSGLMPGFTTGHGLSNLGLLIRTTGTVTATSVLPSMFYIDDGSGVQDSSSYKGLRVWLAPNTTAPAVGQYVAVTGVSDQNNSGGNAYPAVRPGKASDTVVIKK